MGLFLQRWGHQPSIISFSFLVGGGAERVVGTKHLNRRTSELVTQQRVASKDEKTLIANKTALRSQNTNKDRVGIIKDSNINPALRNTSGQDTLLRNKTSPV